MLFCDAHIHLVHCSPDGAERRSGEKDGCLRLANFCFRHEFEAWERGRADEWADWEVFRSFGIHPQACGDDFMRNGFSENLAFLEELLAAGSVSAVGECGFDFFTERLRATAEGQEAAWRAQLELCGRYGKPMVVHVRKAVERILRDTKALSAVPAVVFHSFPGTLREAETILRRGVNAYFSFGKPLLNGKKSALDCVRNLPLGRILLETDAPYQTLKGEVRTLPGDIARVYGKACELRSVGMDELCEKILANFREVVVQ